MSELGQKFSSDGIRRVGFAVADLAAPEVSLHKTDQIAYSGNTKIKWYR